MDQFALVDVQAQVLHIFTDNPKVAKQIATSIRKTGDALGEFATGHRGRVSGTYEKSVLRLPYIIVYALSDGDKAMSILRVIHTSRNWQDDNWPE